jgi:hypothetical protein
MLVSSSFTAMTRSTGEEAARLPSGQLACVAALSRTLTCGELAGRTCAVATELTKTASTAGGRDKVSATTFNSPAICRGVAANSVKYDSWRRCLADHGSYILPKLSRRGLWSVTLRKTSPPA